MEEAAASASQLAARLVYAVEQKQRQGQDNTTVVVVSPYLDHGPAGARRKWLPLLMLIVLLLAGTAAGLYLFGEPTAGGVIAPLDSGTASDDSDS